MVAFNKIDESKTKAMNNDAIREAFENIMLAASHVECIEIAQHALLTLFLPTVPADRMQSDNSNAAISEKGGVSAMREAFEAATHDFILGGLDFTKSTMHSFGLTYKDNETEIAWRAYQRGRLDALSTSPAVTDETVKAVAMIENLTKEVDRFCAETFMLKDIAYLYLVQIRTALREIIRAMQVQGAETNTTKTALEFCGIKIVENPNVPDGEIWAVDKKKWDKSFSAAMQAQGGV